MIKAAPAILPTTLPTTVLVGVGPSPSELDSSAKEPPSPPSPPPPPGAAPPVSVPTTTVGVWVAEVEVPEDRSMVERNLAWWKDRVSLKWPKLEMLRKPKQPVSNSQVFSLTHGHEAVTKPTAGQDQGRYRGNCRGT